jgi:hypothetical protein
MARAVCKVPHSHILLVLPTGEPRLAPLAPQDDETPLIMKENQKGRLT